MKKRHFVSQNLRKETIYVARGFSSIKIHYSVNRLNEDHVFSINEKKHIKFIYNILWNVVTVCFGAITRVIVLAWFLWSQRLVIKVDPRCTSEV